MQQGSFIDVFSALHVSGAYTPYAAALKTTTHHKLGAENRMLQLNI